MDMGTSATIMTVIAGSVTIAWFIRDVRKQNSKVLKSIGKGQENQTETLAKCLIKIEEGQEKGFNNQAQILAKIEKGQREGFEILSNDSKTIAQILERIESNTRKT